MKVRVSLNVALACTAIGLALFLYFKPRPTAPEYRLSRLAPSDVTRITVEAPEVSSIVLEKRDAQWLLTQPIKARAESLAVERILDILNAVSRDRLPATDLARFDLEQPAVRVSFNDETIGFGTVDPLTREQYASSGDSVFLVHMKHAAALPRHSANLISRQLFAQGERPTAFSFGRFAVALQDGKWVAQPGLTDLSQDDFNGWGERWQRAVATLVESHLEAATGPEIRVTLEGGRTVLMRVLQAEPELLLLRTDEHLRYRFPGATGRALLNPPAARG